MTIFEKAKKVIYTADQISDFLNSDKIERYGSAIKKVTNEGKKIIVGHLEANKYKVSSSSMIGSVSAPTGSLSKFSTATKAAENLSSLTFNSSSILGGLTSLGWANVAISGINLGVTAVGMYVISKKINTLSAEVHQMNGKIDTILEEMHQLKLLICDLNDNEIRKLYSETDRQMRHMNDYINELNVGRYNDNLRRDAKKQLIDASSFLDDLINRYTDTTCNIALSLDTIMAHFYTFISLMKMYISTVYLYDKDLPSYEEFQSSMKLLCSNSMVKSIENIYKNSSNSFISPYDLYLITSLHKGIMIEQISEVKSQKQILNLIPYDEYRKINEHFREQNDDDDIIFVRYES